MWRAGYVFARNELLTLVWPEHERLNERVVDVHIGRLRQALRHSGGKDPIRTVRSIGYAFNEATPGAPPSRTASVGADDRAFTGATQTAVSLFADASLCDVMPELMTAFTRKEPCAVDLSFRPSGLLRERIERGGRADMFAAANMDHALELEARGLGGPVVRFAGNELCALVRPGMAISPDNLLDLMLDPDIRVGMSTPNADPCGDCALEMFRRAEALRPGAAALLTAKALRLTGGPAGEQAPEGQNAHAWLMLTDKVDVFLTYRSNALKALAQAPNIDMVMLPRDLEIRADCGLMVLDRAPKLAWRLALFILSPAGKGHPRAPRVSGRRRQCADARPAPVTPIGGGLGHYRLARGEAHDLRFALVAAAFVEPCAAGESFDDGEIGHGRLDLLEIVEHGCIVGAEIGAPGDGLCEAFDHQPAARFQMVGAEPQGAGTDRRLALQVYHEHRLPFSGRRHPYGQIRGDAFHGHARGTVTLARLLRRHRRYVDGSDRHALPRQPCAVPAVSVGEAKRCVCLEVGPGEDLADILVGQVAERCVSGGVFLVPIRH